MRVNRVLLGYAAAPPATPSPSLSARSALTEAEAALYIGMSAAWLKKSRVACMRGRADAPPFVKAGRRRVVYRRRDLDEWLAGHLQTASPR